MSGIAAAPAHIANTAGSSIIKIASRFQLEGLADLYIWTRRRNRDAAQGGLDEETTAPDQGRNQYEDCGGHKQRVPPGARNHHNASITFRDDGQWLTADCSRRDFCPLYS